MTTADGCTIMLCGAHGCSTPLYEQLRAELRHVVRESEFGVLVVSGCALGVVTCRMRAPAPMVAVQPCDTQRRPVGLMIRLGPVRTRDDITRITRWLQSGRFDTDDLPRRLTMTHRAMAAAIAN
jgi:hypothetical protein